MGERSEFLAAKKCVDWKAVPPDVTLAKIAVNTYVVVPIFFPIPIPISTSLRLIGSIGGSDSHPVRREQTGVPLFRMPRRAGIDWPNSAG